MIKFINWLRKIFTKNNYTSDLKNQKAFYFISFGEDIPAKINYNELFIGGTIENPWVVVMCCPCGCGDKIYLNTLEKENPYWEIIIDELNQITLRPSIWRTSGCQSHFFVRKGRIEWAFE